ncbi:MAG: hypothetical protein LQ352_007579, partial [Teloschistes flavicans]
MEDAAALGYMFTNVTEPAAIEKRLSLFEKVRRNRAARVQILSKARIGREREVADQLKDYAEPAGSGTSASKFAKGWDELILRGKLCQQRHRSERCMTISEFVALFDVLGRCNQVLQEAGEYPANEQNGVN